MTKLLTVAVFSSSTIAIALRPSCHASHRHYLNQSASGAFIGIPCLNGLGADKPSTSKVLAASGKTPRISLGAPKDAVGTLNDVRVRFAPSPTGELHVGNLRTFIYNYLYARKNEGVLIFRVDDTDDNREVSGCLSKIIKDLKWLGFSWSEGPGSKHNDDKYYQSKRQGLYRDMADILIQTQKAYRCFCTKEEVNERKKKKSKTSHLSYDKACRHLSTAKITENLLDKKPFTVRFSNVDDNEDFILIRSNGTATYNFACAVDDHSHGITHVIRGVDHLENTYKQINILEAIGTELPTYVHCSLMCNTDQSKLSKRSGDAITISKLREMGVCKLPIVNYLSFLGTSNADDPKCHSIGVIAHVFDLDMLNRTPIAFDMAKLLWLNRRYIEELPYNEFVTQMSSFLDNVKDLQTAFSKETLKKLISVAPQPLKSGVDTMREYATLIDSALSYKVPRFVGHGCYDYGGFFLTDESQKFLETFVEWSQHLITASEVGQSLSELLKDMLKSDEFIAIDGKKHLGVVRYALTGMNQGPPISQMIDLWLIAKEQKLEGFIPLHQRILNLRDMNFFSNDPVAEGLFKKS